MKHSSVLFRFALYTFLFAIIVGVIFCYLDRIASFSINHLTGYRIFYDQWGDSPFNRSDIQGLRFEVLKKGFTVTAKKAHFDLRLRETIRAKKLRVDCRLEDVRFHRKKESKDFSSDTLIAVPFNSNWQYSSMVFSVIFGGGNLKIKGFRALSDDIRLKGESELNTDSGDIVVDLKMSVSPEVAEVLMGDFKETLLVPEENGWFGTEILMGGNVKNQAFHMKSEMLEIRIHSE